jgi:hypothetical protein
MKYFISCFTLFYGYAVVRYHLGKGLDQTYFLFVLNKSFAWSASFYLGISILNLPRKWPTKQQFGLASFALGLIHIMLTLYLAYSNFYPELYKENHLSNLGVSILFSGILSIGLMLMAFLTSILPDRFPKKWLRCGYFAFIVNISHPFIIGFQNWVAPLKWPLYFPPITLLACLISGIILYFRWKQKREK